MQYLFPTRAAGLSCLFALLAGSLTYTAGTEWDDFVASLGNVTSAGGASGSGSDNPNEWNPMHEGGPAVQAQFSEPHMAMDDVWGNIYVADKNAHAIRKITPDGMIHTVAGRHRYISPNTGGYDGDGMATERLLSFPNGLFVLPDGTFYFVETGDSSSRSGFPAGEPETLARVRKVDRAGNMTTLYTDTPLTLQRGLWVSPDESFFYFTTNKKLKRWTVQDPDSPVTLLDLSSLGSADFGNIDVDQDGSIWVTDRGRDRVYRVPPNAVELTSPAVVAGNGDNDPDANGDVTSRDGMNVLTVPFEEVRGIGFHPLGGYLLACHKGGDIWYVDQNDAVHAVLLGNSSGNVQNGNGTPITENRGTAKLAEPRSVRVGWNGDIIICTNDSGYVRVIRSIMPRATLPVAIDSAQQLSWPGIAGKAYFIERSTTLKDGSWTTLESRVVPANGVQTFTDPSDSFLPEAFYRVHEHRAWPR